MAFGLKINTTNGERLLDNQFMLPEFVGKVYINPTPSYDYISTNSHNNAAGVYRTRNYDFAAGQGIEALAGPLAGRNFMIFWKYPDTGAADLWWNTYYFGAMNLFSKNASPPSLPIGYVFAVGHAVASNAQFGMRYWNDAGTLMFDSGNRQLQPYSVATGMNFDMTTINTVQPPMPAAPGFLQPVCYFISDVRQASSDEYPNSGQFNYMYANGGIRRNGPYIQSFMPMTEKYDYSGVSEPNNWSDNAFFGSTTGLVMPIIDCSIYD
jgi:hypothetical protein